MDFLNKFLGKKQSESIPKNKKVSQEKTKLSKDISAIKPMKRDTQNLENFLLGLGATLLIVAFIFLFNSKGDFQKDYKDYVETFVIWIVMVVPGVLAFVVGIVMVVKRIKSIPKPIINKQQEPLQNRRIGQTVEVGHVQNNKEILPHQYNQTKVIDCNPQEISLKRPVKLSALRLANPAHPSRKLLDEVTKIVNQSLQIEAFGSVTLTEASVNWGELEKTLTYLDKDISLNQDMDMLVAKAGILQYAAQSKSAEETLDLVLGELPDHFEAKMWKNHWQTWKHAFTFPYWDEQQKTLHPVMAAQFKLRNILQIVRDGLQKTLVIIAEGPTSPLDSQTQAKVKWVLSQTPYGPLIAYYLRIIAPGDKPHNFELFLIPSQPTEFSPMKSYFLMQQLAFTPYCFVVLANGDNVTLNRKVTFGDNSIHEIRDIASRLSSAQSFIPQHQVQSATQWHMKNFDMEQLTFD
jgi:hypothetical protein